jgi:hypothetical protein
LIGAVHPVVAERIGYRRDGACEFGVGHSGEQCTDDRLLLDENTRDLRRIRSLFERRYPLQEIVAGGQQRQRLIGF